MGIVLTRAARATEWERMGVTGDALECLLSETAAERHQWRVAVARRAAEDHYLSLCNVDRDEVGEGTLAMYAGAILWADVIGIGGRDGVEGYGTARIPALAGCGKGRKQASDGAAWSAAIRDAARSSPGRFAVNNLGYIVYQTMNPKADYATPPEIAGECLVDALTGVPDEWVRPILREGLRRAAGLRDRDRGRDGYLGWHPEVPFHTPPESLAEWSKLVNEATASKVVA